MLWGLGIAALGFTYISAVNVTVLGVDALGRPSGPVCGGMWNPTEWFQYCDSALPPRLGVLTLGIAALIVFGYFAEKDTPTRPKGVYHDVSLDETRGKLYWCKTTRASATSVQTGSKGGCARSRRTLRLLSAIVSTKAG